MISYLASVAPTDVLRSINQLIEQANSPHAGPGPAGADTSGVSDSLVACTEAHASGRAVYYPSGIYNFSSGPLVIPAGGGIIGSGAVGNPTGGAVGATVFIAPYGIVHEGSTTNGAAPVFRDFSIAGNYTTASFGLTVGPSGAGIQANALLDNISIVGFHTGVFLRNCVQSTVRFLNLGGCIDNQILISCPNSIDNDFGTITECMFNMAGQPACIAVHHQSPGDLRVISNKFNNAGLRGYWNDILVGAASGTSILLIQGNSFENMTTALAFTNASTSGTVGFDKTIISGNEFAGNTVDIGFGQSVRVWSNIIIGHNLFTNPAAGLTTSVDMLSCQDFGVFENIWTNGGAGQTALSVAAGNYGSNTIAANTILGYATPISNGSQGATFVKSMYPSPVSAANLPSASLIGPGCGMEITDAAAPPVWGGAVSGGGGGPAIVRVLSTSSGWVYG